MKFIKIFKKLSIPLFLLAIFPNINPKLNELRASNNIIPANKEDINLYRSMGITYICTTSTKGTDMDFEKSLVVATNLFTTVIQQKHGGFIKEGKKEKQKVNAKSLQNNVAFQLVGGAISFCPDNVPKAMEKEFKNQYKKYQESIKK